MKSILECVRLDGRVALITGGAGHVGQALARGFLELGADVCLLDRDEQSLETAKSAMSQGSDKVSTLCFDLEDDSSLSDLPAILGQRHGRLDILVNNAAFVGTSDLEGWIGDLASQSVDTWKRALQVNLTAPFALVQKLSPMLSAHGRGAVLNIGSIYAEHGPDMSLYEGLPMGNPAAYSASKGGLLQLTRWLATNLAPGVRVNALNPGGIYRGQPEAFVKRYVRRTPMARMATEDDLVGAAVFMCSDLSAYMTGQVVNVDGGWGIW